MSYTFNCVTFPNQLNESLYAGMAHQRHILHTN